MPTIAVLTTVGSLEQARTLARALVEQRLAACAQIEPIESFYRWDGALCNEAEYRISFKTAAHGYAALERAIRALHPYELPAIYSQAVDQAYPPYADWVLAQCASAPGAGPA